MTLDTTSNRSQKDNKMLLVSSKIEFYNIGEDFT